MHRPHIASAPRWPSRRLSPQAIAGALALHAVLVWAVAHALHGKLRAVDPQATMRLLWLKSPEDPPPPSPPPPPRMPRADTTPAAPVRPPAITPAPVATAPQPDTRPAPAAAETTPQAAAPVAPPHAAAPALPPLLGTEATRRALRESARQPSLAERAASASGQPEALSTDQRLGRDVQRTARGDCTKGEFAGAGMGLLSLPFWIAAEVRGECQR